MSYLLSLINTDPSLNDPSLKDLNLLQHLDGPIPETADFLCYHINDTRVIQVIRVMDQSHCLFERVVFPMERILFVAIPEAYLEIYESVLDGTISERISCESLRVS
jgi:hypothetical protein